MRQRPILYGLALMAALFVVGALIGGIWDHNDTGGAITVTLWGISVVGGVLLLLRLAVNGGRRRRAA